MDDDNDDDDNLRLTGPWEERRLPLLLLRPGDPASEAARSDDPYLCWCCWFIFRCRQDVAGVDTTERRELLDDVTEAASDSSPAREESREEGGSSS